MKLLTLCCILLFSSPLFAQEFAYHVPDAVTYEIPYEFNDSFYKKGFHEEVFFFQYQLDDSTLNVNKFTLNSDMEFSELTTIITIPITSEISSLDDLYTYFRWFSDGSFHLILSSINKGYEWGQDHPQFYYEDVSDKQFFLEYVIRFLDSGELLDTININSLYPGYYYRVSCNFNKIVIASTGFNSETSRVFFQNHIYSIDTQNLEFWKNGNTATPIIIGDYYVDFFDFCIYKVYNDELQLVYTDYENMFFNDNNTSEFIGYCPDLPIFRTKSVIMEIPSEFSVYHLNSDYSISISSIFVGDFAIIEPGVFLNYWYERGNVMRLGIANYDTESNEWNTDSISAPPSYRNFFSNEHIISYPTGNQETMAIFDTDLNQVAWFSEPCSGFEDASWHNRVDFFEKFGYYSTDNNAFVLTELDIRVGNDDAELIQESISLENYPNPFNPETRIAFSTRENGHVTLDIYNTRGQKVRSLVNDNREAGKHSVVWNGKDDNGKSVASGVFFYRMKSGNYTSTKKMILMK